MKPEQLLIAAYLISLSVYGFIEIYLQRKYSKWNPEKQDNSFLFIVLPLYCSMYLSVLEFVLVKPTLNPGLISTGFVLLYVGIILRIVSLNSLKQSFSTAIEKKEEGKLVTTGMYTYVRHPLYATVLLMSIAGCLVFSTVFCWVFVLLTFLGINNRVKKEEAFLLVQFEDYQAYSKKTKKLIPFIY